MSQISECHWCLGWLSLGHPKSAVERMMSDRFRGSIGVIRLYEGDKVCHKVPKGAEVFFQEARARL
jgi:hypothetical protein